MRTKSKNIPISAEFAISTLTKPIRLKNLVLSKKNTKSSDKEKHHKSEKHCQFVYEEADKADGRNR